MGYVVDAIAPNSEDEENIYLMELKRVKLNQDNIKNYSIIFELAYMIGENIANECNKNGVKIVTINYGNFLFYLMESLVYKGDSSSAVHIEGRDVLVSPHYDFSKELLENTTGAKVMTIPYLWEPWFIDGSLKEDKRISEHYSNTIDKKNIVSLEPNISISKTCIAPLLIAEHLERKDSNKINNMTLFGTKIVEEKKVFNQFYKNLNLYKNNKLAIEHRYSITSLFNSRKIGTIVSNHFYNDLNYVTLEALYLKYPIVHNSVFCKDAGYYYNEFDIKTGSDLLDRAVSTEDHLSDDKIKGTKEILWSFSINNPSVQRSYRELLKNL